jgi:hypothetical protein
MPMSLEGLQGFGREGNIPGAEILVNIGPPNEPFAKFGDIPR